MNMICFMCQLTILLRPFGFISPKTVNYLDFQSSDVERT